MAITAQYEVPVTGTLMVSIDGDVREATEGDLRKMGYVQRSEPYRRVRDALDKTLREEGLLGPNHDLTDAQLNPLRYLFELTTYLGVAPGADALIDTETEDQQLGLDLRAIERVLQLCAKGQGLEASELYRRHLDARNT